MSHPEEEIELWCHPRRPQLCFGQARVGNYQIREGSAEKLGLRITPKTREIRGSFTGRRFSRMKDHRASGDLGCGTWDCGRGCVWGGNRLESWQDLGRLRS